MHICITFMASNDYEIASLYRLNSIQYLNAQTVL